MRVVISQSMLFPWVGLLEQIRLADVFVHYDDVQFSKGSFVNRVQIKTVQGIRWLTVPVKGLSLGQAIKDVEIQPAEHWAPKHIAFLEQSFDGAPYAKDAIALVRGVYSEPHFTIGSLARASMVALSRYFGLSERTRFADIAELGTAGRGSERVLNTVQRLGGDEYVTGHGARNYLRHEDFEAAGIRVAYMNYECAPYPQLHGAFTPYVSSLDLISNCGREGLAFIRSSATPWRSFLNFDK
jgi:hypothetical protein